MTSSEKALPPLRLTKVPGPLPGTQWQLFAAVERACCHLRDHVLSLPEREAWTLICPALRELLGTDPDLGGRLYATVLKDPPLLQNVYDAFADAVRLELADGAEQRWVATAQNPARRSTVVLAMGTSGVVIVAENNIVRTAFLPGQGSPAATEDSRDCGWDSLVMPRHRPMRSGRTDERGHPLHPREERRKERREVRWTDEQRMYFKVFRVAVQFVRRFPNRSYKEDDGKRTGEYGVLKQVLPPTGRLKFEDWHRIRAICRSEVCDEEQTPKNRDCF